MKSNKEGGNYYSYPYLLSECHRITLLLGELLR